MKKIYISVGILLCSILGYGQTAQDECTDATPAILTTGAGYVINGNNSSFTDNAEGATVGWQAFTTPGGTCSYNVTVSYCGTSLNLSVYDYLAGGDCFASGGEYLASAIYDCGDGIHLELVYSGLSPNTTYYYAVGGPEAGFDDGAYTMTLTADQVCAAPNDECDNAIPVVADNGTTVFNDGSSIGATQSVSEAGMLGVPVVWEAVTLPDLAPGCTYDLTIGFCGSTLAPQLYYTSVFTDCTMGTVFDGETSVTNVCSDGAPVVDIFGLPPGTYYYPVIGDFNDGTNVNVAGDYTISFSPVSACAPDNDICTNVTPFMLSTGTNTVTGSTNAATMDGAEGYPFVWEAFTTPAGSCTYSLDISYCNSPTAMIFNPFPLMEDCDMLNYYISEGIEACTTGSNGVMSYSGLAANTTYYLPVLGYYDDGSGNINPEGPYSIDLILAETCPPSNDLCSNVTPTNLQNGVAASFDGTTAGAQLNGAENYAVVWESFTIPGTAGCNYDVEISFCGSTSASLIYDQNIFTSCAMTDSIEGVFSNCTDGNAVISLTNVPPGTYYYPLYGTVVFGTDPDYQTNPVGDYSFTVTATAPNVTTPTITASGPTTFCSGGSVVLSSSAPNNNTWSNGATTQSITVTTPGTYTVYTTSGGCQSAPSNAVTVNVGSATAPVISVNGPTALCSGGSVTLTSSVATGNTWSNGATTSSITVTAAGTYSVTATDVNGCTSPASSPVTVTVGTTPATPTVTASGATTFCSGGNVILTSSAATNNVWSNGATTQSITVNASGSYSVSVSNGACTSAASTPVTVTVNTTPATPTITASGPTTFCDGGSVTLTSSAATGNTWSNGMTTQSITVNTSGSYSVAVSNGTCTSTSSTPVNVTVNNTPATPTITASGPTAFCDGGSVTLTSSAASGNTWSNGATTQSITINASGTFTVSNTSTAGCQSASSTPVTVTENPIPATPSISASGPTTFCNGGSVTLTSSAATGNTWSNGATTSSIILNAAGSYTVSVVANGCSSASSAPVNITVNPSAAIPVITASGPTTFCNGGSVTLTSSAATGNTWSNGQTTASITVNTSGSYTATANNANGCASAASEPAVVTVNPIPAAPVLTPSGSLTICEGASVSVTSDATSGNTWSNGETSQTIVVTTAGSYSATVTENGCISDPSNTVTVSVVPVPNAPVISAAGPLSVCEGETVTLTSSEDDANTWSNGATTASIEAGVGTYTVSVISDDGCMSEESDPVTVSASVTASIDGINVVENGDGNVTATAVNPQGVSVYTWNFGDGTGNNAGTNPQTHTYDENGVYTVTLTVSNDCGTDNAQTDIDVREVLAIGDLNIDPDLLKVYPNPARHQFTIQNKSQYKMERITIFDISGRQIYTSGNFNSNITTVNVSHIMSGSYLLRIDTDKGTAVRKLDIAQ